MNAADRPSETIEDVTRKLDQRNAELAVIKSVQEGLGKKLDIKSIYELVGEKMREIFNAQVFDITTYDKTTNLIEDCYAYEKGDRTLLGPREPKGFRKHTIETRQPLVINEDIEKYMRELGNVVVHGEVSKSVVFVPMISNDEVIGVISLQNIDQENAFSDSDVSLLTTLSNSMSVALENARLFDETTRLLKETEQRTAELSVINSVQEGLAKELDIHGIYELVGEKMREIFNAQVFDIVTYNKSTNLIEDCYSFEKGDRTLLGPREPKGFRKHILDTGKLLVINSGLDIVSLQYDNPILIGEDTKSAVFVPMISGGNVNGVISLQNLDEENAFSESDVSLLMTLSSSMSVALENARLFDETTRLLKETEQRTAELSVINSVQEGLAKELDIRGIYELVGEKMREIFNAQVFDIVTYNKTTNLIEDCYAYEKGDTTLLGPREPKGFRKHILSTGKLLVINKGYDIISLQYDNTTLIGEHPLSAVFVPMISGGNVNGVISLQNIDQENAFSDTDVSLLTTLSNSMSVALENARLFDETNRLLKETEQRTAELSVINSVQEGLAKEMDIHSIYELVGEKMRQIFKAQVIDIVTYNKTNNLITDCYSFEKGDRTLLGPREPKGFRKHVIETAKTLVINKDVEQLSSKYDNQVMVGEIAKSIVFVPMIAGDIVTGVISLQNLDQENAFSTSDVSLLTTLCNSMSVALENARLFDETNRLLKETEQRTAELAVINSVQDGLAKELDIQGIYELVGEKMREIFNVQVIDIVTYNKTTNLIEDCYAYEKGDTTLLGPREPKGFRKHILDTGQLLLINQGMGKYMREMDSAVLHGEQAKSAIFVPMITGGEITGIISLQNLDQENAFSNSDVSLLTTLSNSMSVALENARLFDETTRLLKETEQRTAELAVINSVQDGLAKELDMRGIYNLVGDRLCGLFPDTQTLVIRTFEHETGLEHFQYAIEKGIRLEVESRPFIWANQHLINDRKPIHINKNYVETSKKYGGTGVTTGQPPKSAVFVPMLIGETVTGSISLQNVDRENAFTESDLRLLTTLSNSMSVALENARLFDETNRLLKETEQRTAELSVINSVQEGLAKEPDIQGIYELVGEKMREIFKAQVIDIVAYNKSTNLIEDCYAYEKGDRTLLGPREPKGFRKHVIKTSKTLLINKDVNVLKSEYDNTVIIGEAAKSIVFVPMVAGDEVTGVISLQNLDEENAFSDSDVNLLTTFANSMSVALENARLFNETTRLLAETEQRATELQTVNHISGALVSQLEFNSLIKLVGEHMRDTFKADIVYLALHDCKSDMINFPYVYGDTLESSPFGNGITEKIILNKEPILINHNMEEAFKSLNAEKRGKLVESFMGVPIIVGTDAIGIISVQSTNVENNFNENDQRLLTTIAANVGIAMHNADAYQKLQAALIELKAAQELLVQSEKMASLGELTAGIAHEIQNPLNFVNNFSEVNAELIDEMKEEIEKGNLDEAKAIASDIKDNQEKITHHGKRADGIVKSMLHHSRSSTGAKEPTNINSLADEYLRLAYHGLRAKDKSFNATMKTNFDETIGTIDIITQDIGRVILNLITNAFYAVAEKKKQIGDGYQPNVTVSTKKSKGKITIGVKDNGNGIPQKVLDKIFQPFFTTKPTGEGTGLGLSLSYDIVKAHGGELKVETNEGEGTEFIINLPE